MKNDSSPATLGDTRPRCEHGVVYPDDNCAVCLKRDLAAALVEQERLRQGWVGSDKLFLEYRMKEAARSETKPSLQEQIDFAVQKEACRWAERLNWIHAKYDVDGSDTESGDALDVIEDEIQQAFGKLEEGVTPSAISTREKLLATACSAAFAFIDSHVADPDITDEMCIKHETYMEARRALEGSNV